MRAGRGPWCAHNGCAEWAFSSTAPLTRHGTFVPENAPQCSRTGTNLPWRVKPSGLIMPGGRRCSRAFGAFARRGVLTFRTRPLRDEKPAATGGAAMFKRILFFAYGSLSYLIFLGTFLYAICFIGNFGVPRTQIGRAGGPLWVAFAVDAGLLA